MTFKRKLIFTISALTLAVSPLAPSALADETVQAIESEGTELNPFNSEVPVYTSMTGTVTEIRDLDGRIYIRVDKNEEIIDFLVSDSTVFADINGLIGAGDIKEGDEVKVFYILPQITTMIYPPQYSADVIVKTDVKTEVHADKFNDSLVAGNSYLKLNVFTDTEVIDTQGNPVSIDNLANKNLLVFYKFTTFSIPPQTSPDRIIVLNSDETDVPNLLGGGPVNAVHPIYQLTEEEMAMLANSMGEAVKDADISVNNQIVEAPSPYVNGNGTVMLPVRPIAEALHYEVQWNGETSTATVGEMILLTAGSDEYIAYAREPESLGDAPEIKDGTLYAPVSFFTSIMNTGVMISDNVIHITMVYN